MFYMFLWNIFELVFFCRMTVVRAFICGHMYSHMPKSDTLPKNVADLIVEAISYNTASTSILVVRNTDFLLIFFLDKFA